MTRNFPMPWPFNINNKANLKGVEYNGLGWWMHFRNPIHTRTPINETDIRRVAAHLQKVAGLSPAAVTTPTKGIIQLGFGCVKQAGNIQFFVTKFGQS